MNSHEDEQFQLKTQYYSAQFSTRLRELRAARGWSVRVLAKRIGMSSSLITRLEKGRANPELATLVRLQQAFDLASLEELFGDLPTQRIAQEVETTLRSNAS